LQGDIFRQQFRRSFPAIQRGEFQFLTVFQDLGARLQIDRICVIPASPVTSFST
jgi:hypothetical protein